LNYQIQSFKPDKLKTTLIVFLFFLTTCIFAQHKMVAITIDDLPFVRPGLFSEKEVVQKTDKLLTALEKKHAPATGFVNLAKVYTNGEYDSSRYNLLKQWLGKGFDLGNHTFSHPNYDYTSYLDFTRDIAKDDQGLKPLVKQYNKSLLYFRFPYLHRGNTKAKADSLADYLRESNYIEAPVTIDNAEWIFAAAYDSVLKTNDKKVISAVGEKYLDYMESKVKYCEGQSQKLFGRNIRQILLIHANSLNSEYMGKLLQLFVKNGYSFVSLETALQDDLYKTEDHYYRSNGISWLDRWALTKGKRKDFFKGEPVCPADIMKLAKVDSE
jgi:peptidoglycan/xylan/chitin deacetylase (PgdA/CDA1 family)